MDPYEAPEEGDSGSLIGMTSVVFGLFGLVMSVCCPLPFGICGATVAIPFPVIAVGAGLFAVTREGSNRTLGLAGVALGIVGLVLTALMCVFGAAIGAAIGVADAFQ